jgi:dolichyl-phosphate beta-glucosyltransferase
MLLVFSIIFSRNLPTAVQMGGERKFLDPATGKEADFPSIFDAPSKELSIIVPAYNEEERLPVCLDEMLKWLQREEQLSQTFTYELILVDDGSRDATAEVGYRYARKYGSDNFRVLRVRPNAGKGNAVKKARSSWRRVCACRVPV